MKSEFESVKAENAALKATQEPLLELQALKKQVRANASNNAGSILAQQKRREFIAMRTKISGMC